MYAFISDVHIGNFKRFGGPVDAGTNARCCLILTALDEAIELALQRKASVLFVAGDFLDYVRMEPQIIAIVQKTLRDAKKKGLETVLVLGDHEIVSSADGDHALGPLAPVATVVDKPRLLRLAGAEIACIPFTPGDARKYIPAMTKELFDQSPGRPGDRARILVFHAGVVDAKTSPWLRDVPDAIGVSEIMRLVEKFKIAFVAAGNFHHREIWQKGGATICQPGALVPTGWDNPGLEGYGGVAFYNPATAEFSLQEVVGARFVTAHIDDEKLINEATNYKAPIFLQIVAPVDRLPEAQGLKTELADQFKEDKIEIVPDKVGAESSARQAATISRQQDTLDAALGSYISALTLPSGLKHKDVYGAAVDYLRRGESGSK